MSFITHYLPFASGTSSMQGVTYLVFVCLFSISFLVFLNSSVSFVITDLIGIKDGVGDLVGTLGFADELVALVACPFWGIVSDRLGVRWVCALGYAIVGASLLLFVQARNVYPQLLLARLLFSVGGAATATMVTAVLPSMTGGHKMGVKDRRTTTVQQGLRNSITPSVESQDTMTPELFAQMHRAATTGTPAPEDPLKPQSSRAASPPRMAGLVGVFTGCGALLALTLFLPLPAQFSHLKGVTQGQAVADSFYVVGSIALCVGLACFLGLRNLQGEEGKGWRMLLGAPDYQIALSDDANDAEYEGPLRTRAPLLAYWRLVLDSSILGLRDSRIGLGYLGGFVARASSVGISLFIPLYVNAYFIGHSFCQGSPNDPSPELKKECRAAYVLAAQLTGASQLVALLCAPLFGYLSDRYRSHNVPMLVAAVTGIIGFTAFARLESPEITNVDGRGGSPAVFLIVALIGISQIGAIVCSLGLLGRGVQGDDGGYNLSSQLEEDYHSRISYSDTPDAVGVADEREFAELQKSRHHLKGSIAGVYSLTGGAAILILTKLGGYLFDAVATGAPFYMMAVFNAVLLVVGVGTVVYRELPRFRQRKIIIS